MEVGKISKHTNWPKIIYYKRTNGDIRKSGGRRTIASIVKDLNAREVEFILSKDHNQIYKYNDDKTMEAYLKGGFWRHMVAFERIDAPSSH